jgi:hypothetical protein
MDISLIKIDFRSIYLVTRTILPAFEPLDHGCSKREFFCYAHDRTARTKSDTNERSINELSALQKTESRINQIETSQLQKKSTQLADFE